MSSNWSNSDDGGYPVMYPGGNPSGFLPGEPYPGGYDDSCDYDRDRDYDGWNHKHDYDPSGGHEPGGVVGPAGGGSPVGDYPIGDLNQHIDLPALYPPGDLNQPIYLHPTVSDMYPIGDLNQPIDIPALDPDPGYGDDGGWMHF